MKIATYNVRNLYDAGTFVDEFTTESVQESFFNERIHFFTEKFRALDLDIICLQEIGGEKGVSLIGDALGYDYFFAKPNKRGIRMAVLYKKELAGSIYCESLSLGDLYIPAIQEKGDTEMLRPILQSRDVLEITLTSQEKTISITTFHLKSNLPQYLEGDDMEHDSSAYVDAKFRCVLYKSMELCAIRRHATKRMEEGKEVILLGDYNENSTASSMDILHSSQNEKFFLYDALRSYTGDITTHIHRGNRLTFDPILLSLSLKDVLQEVRVENSELQDCSMLPLNQLVVESDHALVWVDIKI